ncbi:hypothetical protein GE061_008220 [Apolygus lucorum]|uniref:Uncharacterized protein n=1 Tax=Apolygus lucorum TaxID=248454 RepID=A0A8S9WP00_APOLU|nr:hypothetical protein GE061_008220 [Apolygus lucorum]
MFIAGAHHGQLNSTEVLSGQKFLGFPSFGFPSIGYPSAGYPSVGYPSAGYPSVGYPSVGYPSVGYPSVGYPSVGYPSVRYPSVGYPSVYPGSVYRNPYQPRCRPFGTTVQICHQCTTSTLGFIGKLEHMILSLPMAIIRGVIRIPANIVGTALNMGQNVLQVCQNANTNLEYFAETVFSIPARIMSKTIKLFLDFLNRILSWGQSCQGAEYCQQPLPAINGIGPCAGMWPCRQPVACVERVCNQASRALHEEALQSDLKADQ